VVLYFVVIVTCTVTHAPLVDNPIVLASTWSHTCLFIKVHPYTGFLALAQLPIVFLFAARIRYCHSFWDQEMAMRSSTTFTAGPVVACSFVLLSMVLFGSGITANTSSLSWVNKRKPLALPRSHLCVSLYFPPLRPVRIYLRQIFFYVQ